MIVLSEHVDYWNHIGWKDPYSSRFYSDRQGIYAKRLGLDSVYTPQMVVDGTSEFVGSDAALADKAFAKALTKSKIRCPAVVCFFRRNEYFAGPSGNRCVAGILRLARGGRLRCRRSQPCGIASRSRRKRWTYIGPHGGSPEHREGWNASARANLCAGYSNETRPWNRCPQSAAHRIRAGAGSGSSGWRRRRNQSAPP